MAGPAQEVGGGAVPATPRRPGGNAPVAGKGAAVQSPALPAVGTYSYALSGTSSLGPPPATSTIAVADAGGGAQLWTVDSRRGDGAGMVEELTLSQDEAGIHLSTYRLDASTGIAGVILEFEPTEPVLLTPIAGNAGTIWPFDLGTSADGCATATGTGELLESAGAANRRFRLTTTVRTVGPAFCVAIEGERTQEISHPAESLLPTRIASDLRGRVGGVPFTAVTRATRPPDAVDSAAGSTLPIVLADRVRQ